MSSKRSVGVSIFGYLLIGASLFQLWVLVSAGYAHYSYLHQEYPPQVILVRYLVSWVIKIVGIVLGIGILRLNDTCRRLAILNSALIIATVHLKHTYHAYSLHVAEMDKLVRQLWGGWPDDISASHYVSVFLTAQRAIDVIFGLALIFFLTRVRVKRQFQAGS